MNVRAILRDKGSAVATIASKALLADAAQVLGEKRYGALVVSSDGRTVEGILSERDIVSALAKHGVSCLQQPVSNYMTAKVSTITPDATVDAVLELMTAGRFRHAPVVENGVLGGIISIGDVVKRKIDIAEQEAQRLKEYIATG